MRFPLREIAQYIRSAPTEELLDRVTVYREGMEPAALDLMEGELDRRRVTRAQIADYDAKQRATAIMLPDGTAQRCERCDRPAVYQRRGWHRTYGWLPVFRRTFYFCSFHQPASKANPEPGTES
ncbi:hypothetical protein J8F10_10760 [Gemmata sp. G18]|uniref:Uncharacterized protein n=1 Tax=Gemmata palustris TaxID=2822762 RepID=A0ABS5BPZ8_9BACT|nr:hypothetical protein [Gemmata palustris]MBP3955763.1 hypothetical protein [Gemmata palustris]